MSVISLQRELYITIGMLALHVRLENIMLKSSHFISFMPNSCA